MENLENYNEFIALTSCQCFIVYHKDTSVLLMLPQRRDHRGFSRFLKNFKKLVHRIPEADAQEGELKNIVMTWGDAFYIARFLTSELSVLAVFPQDTNLGLILNRWDKINQQVTADYLPHD